MTLSLGSELAESILDYLASRPSNQPARVLIVEFPLGVQKDAAISLAMQAQQTAGSPCFRGGEIVTEFCLIQHPNEIRDEGLLNASGMTIGTSPDFPVKLRNRWGSVVVFCPPELLELCHESIKTNTFHRLDHDRRFGRATEIIRRFRSATKPEDASGLSYVADQLLSEVLERLGPDSWAAAWMAIERAFAVLEIDFRLMGLLPSNRLHSDEPSPSLRSAVTDNLNFQSKLVNAVAQGQRGIDSEFRDRTGYEALMEFLAKHAFRLTLPDWSWRADWPRSLFIEDLQPTTRSTRAVEVRGFDIEGAADVGGLLVVDGDRARLRWSSQKAADREVEIRCDGFPIGEARLKDRTFETTLVDDDVHTLSLAGSVGRLKGHTQLLVMRRPVDGRLLLSVGDDPPGSERYRVTQDSPFKVRWWAIGLSDVESVDIFAPGEEEEGLLDDDRLASLLPSQQWLEIEEGISGSTTLVARARRTNGTELESQILVEAPEDVDSEGEEVTTVARALLQLASQSERGRLTTTPTPIVRVLSNAKGFEASAECGDYGKSLPFRVRAEGLLPVAESVFLDDHDCFWPRLLVKSYRKRAVHWEVKDLPSEFLPETPSALREPVEAYRKARSAALSALQEAGIGRSQLSEFETEVSDYLARYADVLEEIRRMGGEVGRFAALFVLADSVLVGAEGSGSPNSILMSPTHPVRLAWLTQYESWVRSMLTSGRPWAPSRVASLSSTAFPAHVVDWNLQHFVGSVTVRSGTWLLLLPEDSTELDQVLDPELGRSLALDATPEAMTVSRQQLDSAIRQYHQLHPYKDSLRIAYIGAGTAHQMRDAVESIITRYSSSGVTGITAGRLRLELELLDISDRDGRFDHATGMAFHEYAQSDKAQEAVLRRVSFGVRHLTIGEFIAGRYHAEGAFNLVFGSELFKREGRSSPNQVIVPPLCRGLIVHTHRRLEASDVPTFRLTTSVGQPKKKEGPAEDLVPTMHRALFGVQCISAASQARRTSSETEVRSTIVELGDDESNALFEMHRVAEWVYLLDANVDVEYFDNPVQQNHYVLDYVPSFLAAAKGNRQHSYLITSDDRRLIRYAINLFLRPYYRHARGKSSGDEPSDLVTEALNRISGRQVFRLVGEPTAAKGSVGMALAALVYEHCGLTTLDVDGPLDTVLLVPIDDYFPQWIADANETARFDGHHADLLAIRVMYDGNVVYLTPLVVEVKNRANTYSTNELIQGPLLQINNTASVVKSVLGLGAPVPRADRELKNVELAELLDYHLRRRIMQQFGDRPEALNSLQGIRQEIFAEIAEGRFRTGWKQKEGMPHVGAVIHFNASLESIDPAARCQGVSSGGSAYEHCRFSLEDVAKLLEGKPPTAVEGLKEILDPGLGDSGVDGGASNVSVDGGARQVPIEAHQDWLDDDEAELIQGFPETPEIRMAIAAFDGFVGNAAAKERLIPWVAGALKSNPARLAENIAFTGPASTGKTELCRRVARVLELPLADLQGSAIGSIDDLLHRMDRQVTEAGTPPTSAEVDSGKPVLVFPPMVVFLDEAHELKKGVQEQLLPLLEPQTRRAAANALVGDVRDVTFIIATTDWADLISTLQTRFQQVELKSYSEDEVARILRNHFPEWDPEICRRIAVAGRLIPRQALQRASEFSNALDLYDSQSLEEVLDIYYERRWELSEEGLTSLDFEYLRILDGAAGPVGLKRLATRLRKSEREVESNIEPFLQALGLIEVAPQGRSFTEEGKRALLD